MNSLSDGRRNHRRIFTLASSVLLQCGGTSALAHGSEPVFLPPHFGANANHITGRTVNHLVPSTIMPISSSRVVLDAGVGPSGQGLVLDLASASQNISLGSQLFGHDQSVTINVGGSNQTFKAGLVVTAGEYVAIEQVLSSGRQGVILNSAGVATGGSFSLNAVDKGNVSNLTIPANVTAVDHVSKNSLTISGDLTNYGSLDLLSNSRSVTTGTIAASDITNESGASILASNSARGGTLGLDLNAGNNISNAGSIGSSGALSLSAGGGIGNSGAASAGGNVNLSMGSGNLTNTGLVASKSGNINISSTNSASDINVNAVRGTFQALNGNINVNGATYAGSGNINLNGGSYLCQNLNLYAGTGAITTNVDQVTGTVNSSGNAAHEYADTGNLILGTNAISGDPTYVNTGGNITINGGVVANEDITILASGSIIGTGNAYISTARATGDTAAMTADVTLVAGAALTVTGTPATTTILPGTPIGAGNTVSVNFAGAGSGGNIDFSKDTHVGAIISTNSSLAGNGDQNANAGNVTLVAVGTAAGNGTNGQIIFPAKSTSILATSLQGNGGTVTVLAGQVPGKSSKPAITVGSIDTGTNANFAGSNGNITVESATATTNPAGGVITFNSAGAVTTANSITANALGTGNITLGGNLNAGGTTGGASTTISLETGGSGTITQATKGIIVAAPVVVLQDGTGGFGKSGTSFVTETPVITINSTGNVFVSNIGSTQLNAATYGNAGLKSATFSLVTTPSALSGSILISSTVTPTTMANGTSTIIIQSSELPGGTGGIIEGTMPGGPFGPQPAGKLIATTVNLFDGVKGVGNGDIGSTAFSIISTSPNSAVAGAAPINLSANTTGNVFLGNLGPVNITNSSAGNDNTFKLQTGNMLSLDNGQIIIGGTIKATSGLIGTINLLSGESAPSGTGGISQGKGGALTAIEVLLTDVHNGNQGIGSGVGNIGTAAQPIIVNSSQIGASTALGGTDLPAAGQGNVFLTDSNKNGVVVVANGPHGDTAYDTWVLTASSAIVTQANITTADKAGTIVGTITLSSKGFVVLNSSLTASDPNSTINIVASGSGQIANGGSGLAVTDIVTNAAGGATGTVNLTTGSGPITGVAINTATLNVTAGGNVSITNTAGSGQTLTLQSAKIKAGFSLTTADSLIINPSLTSATSVSLLAGSPGINAMIDINNNIGGTSTGAVSILNVGVGNIVSNTSTVNKKTFTPVVTSKIAVILSAAGGNIDGLNGANVVGLEVSAPLLSVNNVVTGGTGTNIVNINSVSKNAVTLLNSASDGNFMLNAVSAITLNNLQSVNGSINVVTSGTSLTVSPNAIISVGTSDAAKTDLAPPGSTLTLENSDTKKGTITIGAGSNILAFVDNAAPAVEINVSIGAPGPGGTEGLVPTGGVIFNPTPTATGPYFFPTQGITVTNAPNITMESTGTGFGQMVFTIPAGVKATAITVEGNPSVAGQTVTPTIINADPPVLSGAPAAFPGQSGYPAGQPGTTAGQLGTTAGQGGSFAAAANSVMQTVTTRDPNAGFTTPQVLSGYASLTSGAGNIVNTGGSNPAFGALNGGSLNVPALVGSTTLGAVQAMISNAIQTSNAPSSGQNRSSGLFGSEPVWISETELAGGKIPAVIVSGEEMGVTCPVSSILDLRTENGDTSVANSDAPGVMTLNRGAVVFAPTADTTVKTPFGAIEIAARSLVFVVSLPQGIVVYNLHDTFRNAVTIRTSKDRLAISPGRMAAIASSPFKGFEAINPCQAVPYRNFGKQAFGGGLNAFTADFHAPSLVRCVMPLNALTFSKTPGAKRLIDRLCKTTAILSTLSAGNGHYKQVLRTDITAMLPSDVRPITSLRAPSAFAQ